jgi:alpha-tubulin suppressor-like RCC1 family protein
MMHGTCICLVLAGHTAGSLWKKTNSLLCECILAAAHMGSTGSEVVWEPRRIRGALHNTRARSVAVSSFTSAAIGEQGQLYTWGNGAYWQLGHGDSQGRAAPEQVSDSRLSQKLHGVETSMASHHEVGVEAYIVSRPWPRCQPVKQGL